jgi:hypothetical protein
MNILSWLKIYYNLMFVNPEKNKIDLFIYNSIINKTVGIRKESSCGAQLFLRNKKYFENKIIEASQNKPFNIFHFQKYFLLLQHLQYCLMVKKKQQMYNLEIKHL